MRKDVFKRKHQDAKRQFIQLVNLVRAEVLVAKALTKAPNNVKKNSRHVNLMQRAEQLY